jgi:hypothetical protein
MPSFDDVRHKIEKAVQCLYKNDHFLITNTTNERSITHKLAEYIQLLFPEWHVDCEYNRRGENNQKDIEGQTTSYPDIIVHLRNTKRNLLIIEAKSIHAPNHSDRGDKSKIKKYIEDKRYGYSFGLWICFHDELEETTMNWFKN